MANAGQIFIYVYKKKAVPFVPVVRNNVHGQPSKVDRRRVGEEVRRRKEGVDRTMPSRVHAHSLARSLTHSLTHTLTHTHAPVTREFKSWCAQQKKSLRFLFLQQQEKEIGARGGGAFGPGTKLRLVLDPAARPSACIHDTQACNLSPLTHAASERLPRPSVLQRPKPNFRNKKKASKWMQRLTSPTRKRAT